jgi:hypothetical protein
VNKKIAQLDFDILIEVVQEYCDDQVVMPFVQA